MFREPLSSMATYLRALGLNIILAFGVVSGTYQQERSRPAQSARPIPFQTSLASESVWAANGECIFGDEEEPSDFISLLQRGSSGATVARGPIVHGTQIWAGAKAESVCLHDHALPQLYLLGPQKSGTTTVASDLFSGGVKDARYGKHCDETACKELHTFESLCGHDTHTSKPKDMSSRCALMTVQQKQEWAQQFQLCTSDNARGALLADMTPANLRLPDLAPMMADLYGELKSSLRFIILLRNPVERMQSGFYHELHQDGFLGHMTFTTEDFGTWLHDVVLPGMNKFNGNEAGMETDASMDQFYRSLMSAQLKPWLDYFNPSQFMLVPMSPYFQNITFRQNVFRQMSEKWGFVLQEPSNAELRHDNKGWHPNLKKDLEYSVIEELNSKFFYPDAVNLASLLSKAIPMGFTLSGYTGRPDSASEIGSFLQSVNYPSVAL